MDLVELIGSRPASSPNASRSAAASAASLSWVPVAFALI